MLYKLRLPLHLQPLHQPQHEQRTHAQTLRLQRPPNTLSEGIRDCPGDRTLECTRGQGSSVVYHHTSSRGTLNVKAGETLVSTILAARPACQESRLGTTSWKGCYSPNFRADGFRATRSQLGLLPGAAPTEGMSPYGHPNYALNPLHLYSTKSWFASRVYRKAVMK